MSTLLQKQFLREFALALRTHQPRHAFQHAMRSCVFVVFMPLCAVCVVILELLFKHVGALRAKLDELWTPISILLVIGLLIFSYVFVKRRLHQFESNPEIASPYDTEADRAIARAVYLTVLLASVGLVMLIFMP